jgi:hypothetical protein
MRVAVLWTLASNRIMRLLAACRRLSGFASLGRLGVVARRRLRPAELRGALLELSVWLGRRRDDPSRTAARREAAIPETVIHACHSRPRVGLRVL